MIEQRIVSGVISTVPIANDDNCPFPILEVINPAFQDWRLKKIILSNPYVNRLAGGQMNIFDGITLLVNAQNKQSFDVTAMASLTLTPTEIRLGFSKGNWSLDTDLYFNQASNTFNFYGLLESGFLTTDLAALFSFSFYYEKIIR